MIFLRYEDIFGSYGSSSGSTSGSSSGSYGSSSGGSESGSGSYSSGSGSYGSGSGNSGTTSGSSSSEPEPDDPATRFNLTAADAAAFDQARAIWLEEIGSPHVSESEYRYADLLHYTTLAEAEFTQAQQRTAELQAVINNASATKAQYLNALKTATREYDQYIFAYQEMIQTQAHFYDAQYWISADDRELINRVHDLPSQIEGLVVQLTSDQWQGIWRVTNEVGHTLNDSVENWDITYGVAKGVGITAGIGVVAIGAVILAPVTATAAGATLLAVSIAAAAHARGEDGQDGVEIALGSVADVTGFTSLYTGVYEADPVTGDPVELSPQERGERIGSGATQLILTVAGMGARPTSAPPRVTMRLPVPVTVPGGVAVTPSGAQVVMPARLAWQWQGQTLPITQPIQVGSTTIGGTNVVVYMTGMGGDGSEDSTPTTPPNSPTPSGPYRGGRHGTTKGPVGDSLESHHTPAKSINGLSEDDGPAIQMDRADHAQTASHGSQGLAGEAYRAQQQDAINRGRFGEAIQMDIDNIRGLFGTKYDEAIQEMLNSLDDWMRIGLGNPPL